MQCFQLAGGLIKALSRVVIDEGLRIIDQPKSLSSHRQGCLRVIEARRATGQILIKAAHQSLPKAHIGTLEMINLYRAINRRTMVVTNELPRPSDPSHWTVTSRHLLVAVVDYISAAHTAHRGVSIVTRQTL